MARTTSELASRLQGYTLPLSPSGRASFVSPPPWHFAGDVLWIDYRADPEAVAAFLPRGLGPADDAGACAAVFVDWQWCSDSRDELADPVRCQFKECFLVLGCDRDGAPAARYAYVWVDRPLSLVRGWIQGLPKVFGSIWITRAIEVGRAGARRRAGERFAASLAADDRRLIEATVTIEGRADAPPALDSAPAVHTRVFPSWLAGEEALSETVSSVIVDREHSSVWRGAATLRFLPGDDPDLLSLAPVRVEQGYVFSYAESVVEGRRVPVITPSVRQPT